MKAAIPVEKDNAHQSPSRKQRQQESVVPLSEVEITNVKAQNPKTSFIKPGSSNTDNNRLSINGGIASVHGSQTIYDQGSEIMYGRLQESLSQTGDINHPDTKATEKNYIASLNVNQAHNYNDVKSGTYLPQTVQEQAVVHQENKKNQEAKQKPISKGNADVSLADLSATPATQLADHFNTVQNNSTSLLNSQSEKATGKLPKVNAKTGSAFPGSKAKSKSGAGKTVAKSSKKTVKSAGQKSKLKEISFPQNEPLKKTSYSFNTTGNKNGELEKQATQQFRAVSLDTSSIPTTMQQNANVDLTGEADTEHLAIEQKDVAQDLSIKKNQAAKDIHKDHGENSIIKKPKDEILKPSRKIKSKAIKKQPLDVLKLEGIDEANINAQFDPIIQSKIGAENEKYEAAELEHNQKVLEHEKAAETQIGIEKDQSQEKQRKSVKDAQADVHNSRVEWQNALNKTETDFAKKSGDQAKATLGNIKTEKSKGEEQAQKHINKANEDALKEKKEADRKAAEKKSEMEGKSGGFFGWLADKVSDFINALKDALNVVFTALRKAVKAIFEAAKKLVLDALEIARKAIVGFIKGFASLLKGFLDIALAAFPGIRDRLKAKIDKYVAAAEKFVNQTFEAFKKAVVAAIDFLADVVDTLLGTLQAVYNFALDAINTIASGIIKMLEFILDIEKQYNLFKNLITGIQEIWNNPKILENYVIGFIAPFIDKIPGEANNQFKKFFAQSGVSFAKHITGVWTHLQPILAYMSGNWWSEMKKMIWYLVWPFAEGGPVYTEAPKLWTLIPEIWNNVTNNNFSKAVDGGLAWMQALNNVVGAFSGWITIGSVLIGGIIGAFFGGVGAIPGIMAGLEFAIALGEGLLISMLATEGSIITKAVFDILTVDDDGVEGEAIKKKRENNESGQDGEASKDDNSMVNYESNDVETGHDRLQYAYQRIANSGFALAIIGVFMALGALATQIVKALKPKFSPKFANFKAKIKNTKAGKAYSKFKGKIIEKGNNDYRPEWMKEKGKSSIREEDVKPIQTEHGRSYGQAKTHEGHTVTITERGEIYICASPCAPIREKYVLELEDNPELMHQIEELEADTMLTDQEKADWIAEEIEPKLSKIRKENNAKIENDLSKATKTSRFSPKGTVRKIRDREVIQSEDISPAGKLPIGKSRIGEVKEIKFTQSSVNNETGDYFVLGNAYYLSIGKPVPVKDINVFYNLVEDMEGLITADNRRLVANKIAGRETIRFQYLNPEELMTKHAFKMTTLTKGTDIDIFVYLDKNGKFVKKPKPRTPEARTVIFETWKLIEQKDGSLIIKNQQGRIVPLEEIKNYLPNEK
ncbi:hypothetical protein [Chryseobacterium geocarposphaerae]|uniref:Putative RNase-like toxin n=1 Tax=Chryseobacterium geocarposphaerae TaxID=1416776 RepID=A0A2M9C9I1_9FLAO|nr:hypothetical protein [Chryseobacterium geocarposphaerae]PJJ67476.1 putative RNase-like toxin [Chryseobacterium geocarposphaerae]